MPLSVGIELEGVALSRRNSTAEFPEETRRRLRLLRDALNNAHIPSSIYEPLSEALSDRPSLPDYTVWNVTTDDSINVYNYNSDTGMVEAWRTRFGFEIVTRIFSNTDSGRWRDEVRRGLRAISSAVRWTANSSTGLHVHIGAGGQSARFSLDEVKKIAIFCCRFEGKKLDFFLYILVGGLHMSLPYITMLRRLLEAMDEFHPENRRYDNMYCQSNRYNPSLRDLTLSEIYTTIYRASRISDICRLMNDDSDESYDSSIVKSRRFKVRRFLHPVLRKITCLIYRSLGEFQLFAEVWHDRISSA
jgi:hypothetical protein